jgi:hypothetical protein
VYAVYALDRYAIGTVSHMMRRKAHSPFPAEIQATFDGSVQIVPVTDDHTYQDLLAPLRGEA